MDENGSARGSQRGAIQVVGRLEAPRGAGAGVARSRPWRSRTASASRALWKTLFPNAGPPEPARIFDSLSACRSRAVSQPRRRPTRSRTSTLAALDEALDALDASREAEGREIAARPREAQERDRAASARAPSRSRARCDQGRARAVRRSHQPDPRRGRGRGSCSTPTRCSGSRPSTPTRATSPRSSCGWRATSADSTRFSQADAEAGRRLEFLLQEMLREANTIGSKSLDLAISHNVVEIKAEIEKMKEQVQNLE